jgi:hypothetical protein
MQLQYIVNLHLVFFLFITLLRNLLFKINNWTEFFEHSYNIEGTTEKVYEFHLPLGYTYDMIVKHIFLAIFTTIKCFIYFINVASVTPLMGP